MAGLAIGAASIIIGGLVAAASAPLQLEKGSWVAAYLVLVAGVAQIVLAEQQRLLHPREERPRADLVILILWTTGNAAVIIGTLQRLPLVVDVGGVALMTAIVGALMRTRGTHSQTLGWVLRILYAVVLVSVPIGLLLAHLRA